MLHGLLSLEAQVGFLSPSASQSGFLKKGYGGAKLSRLFASFRRELRQTFFPLAPNPIYQRTCSRYTLKGARGGFPPAAAHRLKSLARGSELLSNVVFVRRESGGVLQDSVGEDSSLDDERELMACVEASPATCR